eukprot:2580026-Pleurochrysis_carterae.AAC.1
MADAFSRLQVADPRPPCVPVREDPILCNRAKAAAVELHGGEHRLLRARGVARGVANEKGAKRWPG